jgi:UPF0716 protein FxsA
MLARLLLVYAVVELLVTVGLAAAIGVGWTVLVLLGTFVLGLILGAPMGGLQLKRQLMALRSGAGEPRSAAGDGALTALAIGLVVVPGLASTTLGLLLLVPPIRAAARPALTTVAARGFLRRVPLTSADAASLAGAFDSRFDGRFDARKSYADRDYIDGEVIDVIDGEPPTLPRAPIASEPPLRPSAGSI